MWLVALLERDNVRWGRKGDAVIAEASDCCAAGGAQISKGRIFRSRYLAKIHEGRLATRENATSSCIIDYGGVAHHATSERSESVYRYGNADCRAAQT